MRKFLIPALLLALLLCGCGGAAAPVQTVDPYAAMVQVESGYGTKMWVKEHEELPVNPFLGAADLTAIAGEYHIRKGIDVSEHQGVIDWAAVAADGVDFAILRAGYRGYGESGVLCEDKCFLDNMNGAIENGLDIGVYFFSQAVTVAEAEEEADFLLELLSRYVPETFTLPLFFDWEDISHDEARTDGLDGATITDCALAFCKKLEAAGYTPGVYAYRYLAYFSYDLPRLASYPLWIGALGEVPDFYYAHEFWQCRVRPEVDGVAGEVDIDLWFSKEPAVPAVAPEPAVPAARQEANPMQAAVEQPFEVEVIEENEESFILR